MTAISSRVEIRASPDDVWDVISDLDAEPEFWKGTKSVKNISRHGNTVQRYVTIAFKDTVCRQKVTLYPKDKIEFVFTDGIAATKVLTVSGDGNQTVLEADWNIRLSGIMSMFAGAINGYVRRGTEEALDSIKAELER